MNIEDIYSITIIVILLMFTVIPLSSNAVPSNHYFYSIDLSYDDNPESVSYGPQPYLEVAIDDSNGRAVIVGTYATIGGVLYIALYDVNSDSFTSVYHLANTTKKYILVPVSAKVYGNYLIVAAYDLSLRNSYVVNVSLADWTVKWARATTSFLLLDTCAASDGLYVIADPISDTITYSGMTVMKLSKDSGALVYAYHANYQEIASADRARIYCDSRGIIAVGHDSNSKFAVQAYDFEKNVFNVYSFTNYKDFIVQDLVYNPDTDELYAVGGARYDGFNADDYYDPTVVRIGVEDAITGTEPVTWVVRMPINDDANYYFFGGDLHPDPESPWLGLVGRYEFTDNTDDHSFFVLLDLNTRTLSNAIEFPGPQSTGNSYTRGGYIGIFEDNGYVWAFGYTWYSDSSNNDYYNVGVGFISNGIGSTLEWRSTPTGDSWPDIVVNKYDTVSYDNSITDLQSDSTQTGLSPTDLTRSVDWADVSGWFSTYSISGVTYEASDSSTPIPIPEAWYVIVAVIAAVSLVLLRNRL